MATLAKEFAAKSFIKVVKSKTSVKSSVQIVCLTVCLLGVSLCVRFQGKEEHGEGWSSWNVELDLVGL